MALQQAKKKPTAEGKGPAAKDPSLASTEEGFSNSMRCAKTRTSRGHRTHSTITSHVARGIIPRLGLDIMRMDDDDDGRWGGGGGCRGGRKGLFFVDLTRVKLPKCQVVGSKVNSMVIYAT